MKPLSLFWASIIWSASLLFLPIATAQTQPEAIRAAQEKKDALKRAELAKMGITIRGPRYFPREWEWTKGEWTGNDKPFEALRLRIDTLRRPIKTTRDEQKMIARFKTKAQQQPLNAQAQFAHAYAAILTLKPGSPVARETGRSISQALAEAPSPKTYQYDRARYIVLMTWGTWSQLKPLGLRLFKRKPDDYVVKSNLVTLLALGDVNERRQALTYGQQLIQSQPRRVSAHGTLGDVYREMFYRERNVDAGRKAIAAFQKALTLGPNPQARADLEYLIGIIQKRIPEFER